MTIKLANRTAQAGIFYTGSPNYVDVDNTFVAANGAVKFATKAADSTQPSGVWVDNDTTGVLVYKDENNWQVWYALWDATNEYLEVVTLEDSLGTLSNSDGVVVSGVPTAEMLDKLIALPQVVTVSGTTHTTLDTDYGKLHRYTSGSAVTVTLGADCRVNWHALHSQEGAGLVSFARASTDTINGATSNVAMAGQYKTAYTYQPTEGAWIAAV